jgi:hypothetical protein
VLAVATYVWIVSGVMGLIDNSADSVIEWLIAKR